MSGNGVLYERSTGLQRLVLLFATRPHAWQMNFGALTSGLMAFRSIVHAQQVNEHIFSVAQHFVCFVMFFATLWLKNSIEPFVILRPKRTPAACAPWRRTGRSD
jgi:hypothetical protein